MNRGAKRGLLDRVFEALKDQIKAPPETLSIDNTSVKVHPDGTGALKNSPPSLGKSRGGWTTKIPMVAAKARKAVPFSLSPGNTHDAPEKKKLWRPKRRPTEKVRWLMDQAYEGSQNRRPAKAMGLEPAVPPLNSRL